ncbi:Ubiquitin conjugation factor E4 [Microbotryomycetes sp. JL201]|nr:Ubiquitin conjugation factor E4 [Microbotryomycetes sp. JL201]
MAPPPTEDDAEAIRLRRLARLGATSAPSQHSVAPPISQRSNETDTIRLASATDTPQNASTTTAMTTSTPQPSHTPSARTAVRDDTSKLTLSRQAVPQIAKDFSGSKSPTSATATATSSGIQGSRKPSAAAASFTDTYDQWQNAALERILQVTLDQTRAEQSQWTLTLLKEVADEVTSEDAASSLSLKVDWTDRLLLARLSLPSVDVAAVEDPQQATIIASLPANMTAFEYLSACWKRGRAEKHQVVLRKGSDSTEADRRLAALDSVKDLVVSYTGLVLLDPTMFPQEHIKGKPIGPIELEPLLNPAAKRPKTLLLQPSDATALLTDLASRYAPSESNGFEGGLENILEPLVTGLAMRLLTQRIGLDAVAQGDGASWRDIIGAVQQLTELKPLASALTQMSRWDMTEDERITAPAIEMACALGPFLRVSMFPETFPSIAQNYFPEPTKMGRGNVESATASLQNTLSSLQSILFTLINNIVRSGAPAREAVLNLFASTARLNAKRAAMRVDPATVSSHGFILNIHTILLDFAKPFLDPSFSKARHIDKIDPLFYKHSKRVDISSDTKISATQQESDEYYADPRLSEQPPNFISDIFFLTATFLHIGLMHVIKEHKGMVQQIRFEERQIADIEHDSTWRGTPQEGPTQAAVDRLRSRKERWLSHVQAYQVQLLHPTYLGTCIEFANLTMAWLVRQVDPKRQHPQRAISLPLPKDTPENFRFLPEYLIEDITELFSFASKYAPQSIADSSLDELLTFMLVFLSTPYMKNPYLKGQFVEIMYYLCQPLPRYPRGCLGEVLNVHPMALDYLMPCLVHAFVEIEVTGSHTQFYDKFNIRYYITQLFKAVWSNPAHRDALRRESQNLDRYVRFANLLMNDTTYLLDDALMHLGKIVELQRQMDDQAAWQALPVNERQEKEKLLRQYEGSARSDLDFGVESLRLLKRFAAETTQPFLAAEIVDRLAAMLDMNLSLLAGPKCQDLKVREPEKYRFRPKELLSDLLDIFLQLAPHSQFQNAVAKDGRSYSKALFERAKRIALKTAIKTPAELQGLDLLVNCVEAIRLSQEEDDASGEVPDEYLDPLTYEIMRDPVILPASKAIVDRSTIKQHFLSDPTDPFNRAPLAWESITDAGELKVQIEAFLADRKARKTAAADASAGSMQVD